MSLSDFVCPSGDVADSCLAFSANCFLWLTISTISGAGGLSWNFGLARLVLRLRSSAELLRLAEIGAPAGAKAGGVGATGVAGADAVAAELEVDLGDDLGVVTLICFFTAVGFLFVCLFGVGAFKSFTLLVPRPVGAVGPLLVLEDGEPLVLLVEPTSRPTDLFKGLLLALPVLALRWRPLLDILAAGCGGADPVVKNWNSYCNENKMDLIRTLSISFEKWT